MSNTGKAVIVVLSQVDGAASIRTPGILTCEDPIMGSYVVTMNSGHWYDTHFEDSLFKIEPSSWTEAHEEVGHALWITEGEPEKGARSH